MTLAKRIIPTMLCRGRTLVKGQRYAGDRSIGHVLQAARIAAVRGVDELLILDIAATAESRGPDLDLVRELSEGCFIPITVGGGVRSLQDIDALLRAGADKVCIGTAAFLADRQFASLSFMKDAAMRFGSQAIVASLDVRGGRVTVRCGTEFVPGGCKPLDAALQFQREGAGEILLSSIDRDGTMEGYDLDLIREVAQSVSIPVIASGGCSGHEDMLAAFRAGADACAAGALFAFSDETPRSAAKFLHNNGVVVRCV